MSLRPSERTEVRRNWYKVAVDADDGRRRREDNMIEIRKSKWEESLQKKRREGIPYQNSILSLQSSVIEKKSETLPAMVAGVYTDDNNMQLEATTQFKKFLSIERSPQIEEVIQAGIVPRLVEFLMRRDFPQLQFEAAWALTNIASGTSENTKVVIDHGAVPIFVQLLQAMINCDGFFIPCRDLTKMKACLRWISSESLWSGSSGASRHNINNY